MLLGHQDFQYIDRKALQVILEVISNAVRIVHQLCEVELAGVIELEPRNALHGFYRKIRIIFELCYDRCLSKCQRTLKAANDGHRNDDILILGAAVKTTQFVCDGPDKVYFCGNIDGQIILHCIDDILVCHCRYTSLFIMVVPCYLLFYNSCCPIIRTLSVCQSSSYNAGSDRGPQRLSGRPACMRRHSRNPQHSSVHR